MGASPGVIYTAPAKKPTPNTAYVGFTYEFKEWDSTGHSHVIFSIPQTTITIIDRGYRATGRNGDIVFSGVICSLDKPFIVNASWLTPIETKFDPAAGTWAFSTKYAMLSYSGNGTFTIEGADSSKWY